MIVELITCNEIFAFNREIYILKYIRKFASNSAHICTDVRAPCANCNYNCYSSSLNMSRLMQYSALMQGIHGKKLLVASGHPKMVATKHWLP